MESRFHSCDSRGLLALMELSGRDDSSGLDDRAIPSLDRPEAPRIDGYEITGRLGEGGMGVVWRAIQLSTRRPVALKVLAPHRVTRKTLVRFEREIALAARLEHPHIARVYESGTRSGLNYYVMELVEGNHLDRHVLINVLDQKQILILMRNICLAVQFAHQRGVIHRDIKPSNILVTSNGQPRILDFGLAKATSEDSNVSVTQEGHFAGTPAFMSPEQARGDMDNVDTRSDVYSLGATLYLLLIGQTAHDLNGPRYQAIRRIADEEVRSPKALKKNLDLELEWILLKALSREPNQRYGSADAFARDIDRYLNGEPLEASPPSKVYRFRKFTRKHRAALRLATAIVLILAAATAISTWQAVKATHARADTEKALRASEDARQQAEAVSKYLVDTFRAPNPFRDGREVKVTEMLDRAVAELDEHFISSQETRAQLLETLGQTYAGLGLPTPALKLFEKALAVRTATHGPDHPLTLSARNQLASTYASNRQFSQAIAVLDEVLRVVQPKDALTHSQRVNAMRLTGYFYGRSNQMAKSVEMLEEAMKLSKSALGAEDRTTLSVMSDLALSYRDGKQLDQAIPLYEQALKISRTTFGVDSMETLNRGVGLAEAYRRAGRVSEAISILEPSLEKCRSIFGPIHQATVDAMIFLSFAYRDIGRPDLRIPLEKQRLDALIARLGPDHDQSLAIAEGLGILYQNVGRWAESAPIFENSVRIRRAKYGADDPSVALALWRWADGLLGEQKFAEAELRLNESLTIRRKRSDKNWQIFHLESKLGGVIMAQKRFAEAEPLLISGYAGQKQLQGPKVASQENAMRDAIQRLAHFYEVTGNPIEARRWQSELGAFQLKKPVTAPTTQSNSLPESSLFPDE